MLFMVADSQVAKIASAEPAAAPQVNSGSNETEAVPPVPQDTPMEEPQRDVPPGNVTQGWQNDTNASQVDALREPRLVENEKQVQYETAYGNFFLPKDRPIYASV